MLNYAIDMMEKGLLPDRLVGWGIRRLLRERLTEERQQPQGKWLETLKSSPLAIETDAANRQHYEVPAAFYQKVLGPHLKYSSCFFSDSDQSLAAAEAEMLQLTCQRAQIADGQRILELGCGWGSLTLWVASHFRDVTVTAVTNSQSQAAFIERRAKERELSNISVLVCDMRHFSIDTQFDRVISVEMFEHMRNYQLLFERISGWLKDDGKLFFHIFCHRQYSYPFETEGEDNWMGKHFFTGGMMPSFDLPCLFQNDLNLESRHKVNGHHYAKTCQHWLERLDREKAAVHAILAEDLPASEVKKHFQRWRVFFMACRELFAYNGGDEWYVGHYRFTKNSLRES